MSLTIKRAVLFPCLLLLTAPSLWAAEPETYCHDAAAWQEWDDLRAKYPDDPELITLYALRVGLCAMVEKKQIDADTARKTFDAAHQQAIGRALERRRGQEEM